MFIYDENKRVLNLEKHKLDFQDAGLVYNHPMKITFHTERHGEVRALDVALVEIEQAVLALVYTMRGNDVRLISFRYASREERKLYAKEKL